MVFSWFSHSCNPMCSLYSIVWDSVPSVSASSNLFLPPISMPLVADDEDHHHWGEYSINNHWLVGSLIWLYRFPARMYSLGWNTSSLSFCYWSATWVQLMRYVNLFWWAWVVTWFHMQSCSPENWMWWLASCPQHLWPWEHRFRWRTNGKISWPYPFLTHPLHH